MNKTNHLFSLVVLLMSVLCAAGAAAQPFRVNRQRLCIEGGSFVRKAASAQNYLYMEDFTINAGQSVTVPVYLHSTERMWMLQADVALPDGLTVTTVDLADTFTSTNYGQQFGLDQGAVAGGYRVVLYNGTKTRPIPIADRLHVLDLTLTADAGMTAQQLTVWLRDMVYVNYANEGVEGADQSCTAACVVTVDFDEVLATSIDVAPATATLGVGETAALTAIVQPDDVTNPAVTWTTSNAAVATVTEGGVVTAVAAGTASITATTADGTNLSAACAVTVRPVPATGITLNKTATTMNVGATETLAATVTPANATNKAVSWSSSNMSVVTIDQNGVVAAVAPGTATITATTTDGTNLSATCAVTVVQPATGIALNKAATTINAGSAETLTATVTPGNATNPAVSWRSSAPTVATVSSVGVVAARGVGTATITATTKDGTNLSASCRVTVYAVPATTLSLDRTFAGLTLGTTVTLTAIVQPDDTTNPTVTWTSNDPEVAAVDQDGVVTGRSLGMTTIIAQTTDGSNLVAACAVRVCPRGDINLDGVVDVSDVNICINIAVDKDNAANYDRRAYITDDDVVDISDVNALINILLGN